MELTDQEIKSFARGYAEENYNVRGGVDIMADEAENVIIYNIALTLRHEHRTDRRR